MLFFVLNPFFFFPLIQTILSEIQTFKASFVTCRKPLCSSYVLKTAQGQVWHQRFQLVAISVSYTSLNLDTEKTHSCWVRGCSEESAPIVLCPQSSQTGCTKTALQYSTPKEKEHGKDEFFLTLAEKLELDRGKSFSVQLWYNTEV